MVIMKKDRLKNNHPLLAIEDFKLTERELEIIQLLSEGYNSKAIGKKLFLSPNTIDTYRRKLLSKTGAKNVVELVVLSLKQSLIT